MRDPFLEMQLLKQMSREEIEKHNRVCNETGEGYPISSDRAVNSAIETVISVLKAYSQAPDLDRRLRHILFETDDLILSKEQSQLVYALVSDFFNGAWNMGVSV